MYPRSTLPSPVLKSGLDSRDPPHMSSTIYPTRSSSCTPRHKTVPSPPFRADPPERESGGFILSSVVGSTRPRPGSTSRVDSPPSSTRLRDSDLPPQQKPPVSDPTTYPLCVGRVRGQDGPKREVGTVVIGYRSNEGNRDRCPRGGGGGGSTVESRSQLNTERVWGQRTVTSDGSWSSTSTSGTESTKNRS